MSREGQPHDMGNRVGLARSLYRKLVPRSARRAAFVLLKFLDAKGRVMAATAVERIFGQGKDGVALPPPRLRHRVVGVVNAEAFFASGAVTRDKLLAAVKKTGRDVDSILSVLDFGCGCGRVVRTFIERGRVGFLAGCDIDAEAITWCVSHLPGAEYAVNSEWPPLPYPDRRFDLVYSISIFTHLDEAHQDAWLAELKRVTARGGIVLLTVHSFHHLRDLSLQEREVFDRSGFLFKVSITGAMKPDGLPDFYQTAYHRRDYFEERCRRFFEVLDYVECGIDQQNLFVLRA